MPHTLTTNHLLTFMILKTVTCSFCLFPFVVAQYTPASRWAQAVALQDSTLYVHGGLSDPFNSYSYTSAPEISDLLVLDLSTSFNASSPPWKLFSSHSSPTLAWHTLSAFSTIDLLLFGGQPGADSSTVLTTRNDSSGLLSTRNLSAPSFHMEAQNWANEPMRRIRHSASFTAGKVWIVGGERADGSGNAFNEHYSFSPSSPEFVQLPSSSSAPPDIYGHTSLVLSDGRLLVLGGYCASCAALVPMNVAWSLDPTQNPPAWEILSISNNSLPSPRRDFASVILSNGQVLIHGGGDAQLQTTYSDGWILDTGQNPMVWGSVAALSQLGPRKDHFAVQAGGYVLFCFGYSSSSPASASLFIYDPTASSMAPSYSAPSPGSIPAITSLAAPSQTGSKPNSDGGTPTAPLVGSSGTSPYGSGAASDSSKHTTAIALGTVFGFLGLVAGCLATIYYMKRHNRRKRTSGRFFPLSDDPESPSEASSVGGVALEAARLNGQPDEGGVGGPAVIKDILAHFGVDKFNHRPTQPRRDMFVDEDTRSFGLAGPSDTVQRRLSDRISIWSLRSVSALVRGVIGREPSGSGGGRESENGDHLRDGARDGLIRQTSLPSEYSSHLTQQRDGSVWSYNDSLENPLPDNGYENSAEKEAVVVYATPISDEISTSLGSQDSVWPFSVRSRMLTPLREASRTSLSDPSNSLPSIQDSPHGQITFGDVEPAVPSSPTSISPMPHSPTISRVSDPYVTSSAPQYSPISGTTQSHSPTTPRPDSWWSRLTKSPLLDRRTSITSSKPLDFRDPTPAPPLSNLEDMKPSSTSEPSDDKHAVPAQHGRTVSSAHSGRTANTDSAEHLGGRYDVVQRLPSDGSSSRRAPSLGSAEITEGGMYAVNARARSEISVSSSVPHVDPPHSSSPRAGPALSIDIPEAPSVPLVALKSDTTTQKGASVASRVKAYERRMSQEIESHQISPLRNTRHLEQVPSRTRPTIQYGVAPRGSLFIANPDLGHM